MSSHYLYPTSRSFSSSMALFLRQGLALATALLALRGNAITFPPTATVPTHALRFGGGNQYVSVPYAAALNVTTQFTIEAWINIAVLDKNDMTFVSKGDDLVIMRNGNTSKLNFRTKSNSGTDDLLSTANVVTGRWYHVAAVCNGATKTLYLDGVLDAFRKFIRTRLMPTRRHLTSVQTVPPRRISTASLIPCGSGRSRVP